MADFKRSYFDELQDYIQGGSKDKISEEAERYLDVLYLLINLRRKYGKENAIAFIQRPPFGINYRRARLMFDEAVNLFYTDDGIDRQAMNNMIAEDIFKAAQVVLLTAKSAKDMEIYGKLMMQGREAKGLDKEEAPKLPEEFYKKPIKVYSLDPAAIKLEAADRDALAARIDSMDIPEDEKTRLRRDAQVEDVDFIEMFDEQEKKTRSEA